MYSHCQAGVSQDSTYIGARLYKLGCDEEAPRYSPPYELISLQTSRKGYRIVLYGTSVLKCNLLTKVMIKFELRLS